MISLAIAAIAGTFAWQVEEGKAPPVWTAASHQTASFIQDSLRLTYVCGNRFRVRNANDVAAQMKWDVYGTADSGRIALPARAAGQPFSEVFFTTAVRGTTRLFYEGQLIETKANGETICPPGNVVPAVAPDTVPRGLLADSNLVPVSPGYPGLLYGTLSSSFSGPRRPNLSGSKQWTLCPAQSSEASTYRPDPRAATSCDCPSMRRTGARDLLSASSLGFRRFGWQCCAS